MQRLPLTIIAAAALLLAGFAAGRFTAGRQSGDAADLAAQTPPRARAISQSAAAGAGKDGPGASAAAAPALRAADGTPMDADGLKVVIERLRGLDPQAYAEAMAASEDSRDHAKKFLYRAALEMSATSAQAAAYLRLYKERRGMTPGHNVQDLRSMLTHAGQREGAGAIKNLLEQFPDGFNELDSLVHGVARHNPQEAVDWYNQIPDDSKLRASALTGMMFGLGENGTDAGIKVFAGLSEEDQAACIGGFANAYSRGRGLQGATELLDAVPVELRDETLSTMLPNLIQQPPETFLSWAASYVNHSPAGGDSFHYVASRFAARNPEGALAWADRSAGNIETAPAVNMIIGSLATSRPELARTWLAAHPDHPGAVEMLAKIPQ